MHISGQGKANLTFTFIPSTTLLRTKPVFSSSLGDGKTHRMDKENNTLVLYTARNLLIIW